MRGYDECWPWLAGVTTDGGYGQVRVPRRLYYFKNPQTASRVAYYISHFNDPFSLMEADRDGEEPWVVHHECENPICCNPLHLRVLPNREHLFSHHRKRLVKLSYPSFILAYSHHLPKDVDIYEVSPDEHWDWRNKV